MGSVVISLDAELSWGFRDFERLPPDRVRDARRSWLRLLEMFDEFEIPATWAVVGHLLLDECDCERVDHPASMKWFPTEPDSGDSRKGWFGDGLIEAIQTAEVDHEIGGHSFSHLEFGDDGITAERADAELRASVDVANERDIELRSFVYPRNKIGHRDLLAKHGFTCYRGIAPERWFEDTPVRPLGKMADVTVGRSPPLVEPAVDEYGLVNIPASLYLFSFENLPRRVAEQFIGDPIVRCAKTGIDSAASEDGVFHMWFHPNNLSEEADFDRVRSILSYLSNGRSDELRVETMDEVASRTRGELR